MEIETTLKIKIVERTDNHANLLVVRNYQDYVDVEKKILEILRDFPPNRSYQELTLSVQLSSNDPNVRPALFLCRETLRLLFNIGCVLDFDPYCELDNEVISAWVSEIGSQKAKDTRF
jgi:hypothetical protein